MIGFCVFPPDAAGFAGDSPDLGIFANRTPGAFLPRLLFPPLLSTSLVAFGRPKTGGLPGAAPPGPM